jgi:hypothetical protein
VPVAGDGEEADHLLGRVVDLVGAAGPELEADRLALVEHPLAVRRAQGRPPAQHDHHLLVGVVEVVRVGRLSRRQLPEADPDRLAAELVADPGALGAEAGRAVAELEVRFFDVRHAAQPSHGLKEPFRSDR